jgi:predicted metal-dependent hydrolase
MSVHTFISPFGSVSVDDPRGKGGISRKIPKSALTSFSSDLTYVIVPHAKRKRFSLVIGTGEYVEVRTPKQYTKTDMISYEAFIVSNQAWILRSFEKYSIKGENFLERNSIQYLGKEYPFVTHYRASMETKLSAQLNQDTFIEVYVPLHTSICPNQSDALVNWYQEQAEKLIPPLMKQWVQRMNTPFPKITYSCMKSRWAVCYPTRNMVKINIFIMKTPIDCIEYLVVHELSHFFEQSHGKQFWRMVGTYMPDYKLRKKELKKYTTSL